MANKSVASIIPWHQPEATRIPEKQSRAAKPRKPSKPKSKAKAAASDDELQASDAIEVDTTGMGIDDVVAYLLKLLNSKVSK